MGVRVPSIGFLLADMSSKVALERLVYLFIDDVGSHIIDELGFAGDIDQHLTISFSDC
jgi:hypothetical protein